MPGALSRRQADRVSEAKDLLLFFLQRRNDESYRTPTPSSIAVTSASGSPTTLK
jgi:hypothetical protein